MVAADPDLESAITNTFDSEESVMIVLALRDAAEPMTVAGLLTQLEERFRFRPVEERRLVEKRLEIRLRELIARALVEAAGDDRYRYKGAETGLEAMVAAVADLFTSRRDALDKLLYSTTARGRRLAEAFRL